MMKQYVHTNNFDFLRLCFALFVIFTHSYSVTGNIECDPLCQLFGGDQLSTLGVNGFFAISGYLIFISATRSKSVSDYFVKRLLRIYPALIVVLLITLIIVPFLPSTSSDILNQQEYYSYLPKNLSLYKLQMVIPGVFSENPYPDTINGCLWTLKYEFTFYILTALFVVLSNRKIQIGLILIVVIALIMLRLIIADRLAIYGILGMNGNDFVRLASYFSVGSLIATMSLSKLLLDNRILLLSSIGLIVALTIPQQPIISILALPLFTVSFGLNAFKGISSIGYKIGDLSYGIYIYGFLIQQILMSLYQFSILEVTIYTTIITLIFAYSSWHLVEKRALKLKSKLS